VLGPRPRPDALPTPGIGRVLGLEHPFEAALRTLESVPLRLDRVPCASSWSSCTTVPGTLRPYFEAAA
jgi:hypothetical protein